MVTINIFDCGCVPSRPKEQSCKAYGTRFRVYVAIKKDLTPVKILLKCRDCGRLRHFQLIGANPSIIQYQAKESIDLEEEMNNGEEV